MLATHSSPGGGSDVFLREMGPYLARIMGVRIVADETVRNIRGHHGYAQPPHLFLNQGNGTFRDVAPALLVVEREGSSALATILGVILVVGSWIIGKLADGRSMSRWIETHSGPTVTASSGTPVSV